MANPNNLTTLVKIVQHLARQNKPGITTTSDKVRYLTSSNIEELQQRADSMIDEMTSLGFVQVNPTQYHLELVNNYKIKYTLEIVEDTLVGSAVITDC